MRIIIFSILGLYMASCIKEQETTYNYKIINNSNYNIRLNNYSHGTIIESIYLLQSEQKELIFSLRGENGPSNPPFGDSIEVVFGDSISIIHGSQKYNVDRSLKQNQSYNGGHKTDGSKKYMFEYHYEYIFTNVDYEEAKGD